MFSFRSRPKPELGAVFDIGSSSVAAALIEISAGKPPHVLRTVRESLPMHHSADADHLFKTMLEGLKRASRELFRDSDRIKHATYVFASPWSSAETHTSVLEKKQPFVLTKAMVDKVLDSHDKSAHRLSSVERSVVQVTLNGYHVDSPYGKRARRAEVSVLTSTVPKGILEEVVDATVITHHPKDARAFSFPLVAFTAIRDIAHHTDDFMALNVGGDVSEVSIIRNGVISEVASFPLGTHFLVRQIKSALDMSQHEAESYLSLHASGRATREVEEKIRPVVAAAAKVWVRTLHAALVRLSGIHELPHDLFAIVEGDVARFFMKAIREEKARYADSDDMHFAFTLLAPEKLKELATFAPEARPDSFIALASAFANRNAALDTE